MKNPALKPNYLFLLAVMSLLALTPALCLANSHERAGSDNHALQSATLDLHVLEAGLRTGRLTSNSPWRSISKKDPELANLAQKLFRSKARLTKFSQLNPVVSLPVHHPPFLVLRI